MSRPTPARLALPVLAACAAVGGICAHAGTPAIDACATRIIVAFSKEQSSRPSDFFVRDVARAGGVRLTFLRTIGPDLYLFSLTAPDASCRDALERLRRDARVRSVDVDRRRRAGQRPW